MDLLFGATRQSGRWAIDDLWVNFKLGSDFIAEMQGYAKSAIDKIGIAERCELAAAANAGSAEFLVAIRGYGNFYNPNILRGRRN